MGNQRGRFHDASPMIRRATTADCAAVTALVNAAYGGYPARIGDIPGPLRDDYARRIAEHDVFLLEEAQALAGVIVLVNEGDVMLLDNVAVDPVRQGRGHGNLLIAFAEAYAREAGCHTLRLYTHAKMSENIARYAWLGFEETHRATDDGLPRVFMRKALRPAP
jgi:GNAT superfamily N-acetyltransferase